MHPALEIFPWNENFETGIAAIDEQHRGLVALLNELVGHLAYASEAPAVDEVFQRLTAYALQHFRDEEAIWAGAFGDDDWVRRHHAAHEDFVAEVLKLKATEATRPHEQVLEEVVGFLTHWLALHILDADRRLARAVLNLQQGHPPERAKALADETLAGSTRLMIQTVLSMYDKIAVRTVQLTREMALRKSLEDRLQRAYEELQRAKDAADAANRAKSAYLATMSHEIRTPLNGLIGMARLIRQGGLEPLQRERLTKLEDSAAHLLRIVNDILDLSKIEAGQFTLAEQPLRVQDVVAAVVTMLEAPARAKGLQVVVDVGALPEDLCGDATRLQQALLNYAGNAVKFTDAGRITLRVRAEAEDEQAARLRFEVADTGPGIPPEMLERIFEHFEQGPVSVASPQPGTGLGLPITRRLARLMGGDAGVHSRVGEGSVFWFTAVLRRLACPVATAATTVAAEPGDAKVPFDERLRRHHTGARVLLAEDNDINREVATALLEDVGLVVDTAANGAEAVERARSRPYRLVLMDMQMPVMDGLQATRELRRTHPAGALPVIAMTANAFAEDKQRCLEAGMDDFLGKPVEPDDLYAVLWRWLQRSQP